MRKCAIAEVAFPREWHSTNGSSTKSQLILLRHKIYNVNGRDVLMSETWKAKGAYTVHQIEGQYLLLAPSVILITEE